MSSTYTADQAYPDFTVYAWSQLGTGAVHATVTCQNAPGTVTLPSFPVVQAGSTTSSLTMTLSQAPSSGLAVTPTATGLTFNPPTIAFGAGSSSQTFTVTADAGAAPGPVTISYALGGADAAQYTPPASSSLTVLGTISPPAYPVLTQGSTSATLTMTASAAGNVTLTPSATGLTFAPTTLNFSTGASQNFTVTAASNAGPGAIAVSYALSGANASLYATPPTGSITVNRPVPTISSISPTSGPATGGTTVTITGTDLTAATAVTFGATAAAGFTVNSATSITATAPAGTGTVDVRVTTSGGTSATSAADQFTYIAAPTVSAILPSSGPAAGGTTVTITGTDLTAATAVTFGATAAAGFTVNSATSITATAPAGTGTVDVRVSTAGGTSSTSAADRFTYIAAPTVTAISPTAGPTAGGTTVTLTGTSFSGATSVTFGATAATGFTVNSPTSITATAPAGTGTVDIRVTTAGGTSAISAADQYTYIAAPTVSSISPNSGSVTGGTSVTVSGTNLTGATSVTFGSMAASSFTVDSATSITATVPAHAAGAVNVAVATVGGTGTLVGGYTFLNPPVAGNVSLTVAPNSASNAVTLSLSGGAAASVAVATQATHGTATASGLSITFTPTPGYVGSDSFTYTATNAGGTSAPATVSVTVSAPTIAIGPSTLSAGAVATTYSQTITASGGTSSYTYAVTSGSLPAGLTLSPTSGVVSGTPTAGGTFNFIVTITDSSTGTGPFTGTRAYSLTIASPTISVGPTTLSSGTVGTVYSQTITASGGTSSYTYAVTAGALPAGLSLSTGGLVSGTPTAGGSFNVTITATDSSTGTGAPFTGSQAYSLTISAPTLAIAPATIPTAALNTVYSQTITASGGTAPYHYTVIAGALPNGLALSPAGTIAGTPTVASTFNFTITATDSSTGTGPFTNSKAYSLVVTANPPVVSNVSATVPPNSTNTPVALSLSGGTATSVAVVAQATHGTANASGTAISYTPAAGYVGTDSFTYTASNADGTSAPATVSITVSTPTIAIAPATLPTATVATAYSETITASGGTSPYSYAVTTGVLPAGLTLSSGGVLSGTPTASGTFNLTITATDSSTGAGPFSASRAYTLVTNIQAPVAGNVAATVAANSSANAITLAVTGGAATSAAIVTPAAHGTATATSATTVAYTPVAGYSGPDSFTYTATNGSGTSAPATISITVTAPTLSFSPASGALAAGMMNAAYSQTVTASGGTSPYGYGVTGTLPAGLTLNHATGAITGTPTASGNYSFSISATDANNATTSAAYTIAIAPPPTTFVFSPAGGALTEAMAGEAYSQQVSATGGTGVKIYSLASGSLPNGLVLNISTGQLNGPLASGTEGDYSFTIQVRDGNGATATAAYTLKVKNRSVTVADEVVNVPAGSAPGDVYLNRGATGGPFTAAILAFVEPANAGTVTIIQGQLAQAGPVSTPVGWYLHYTPNPAYSGQVRVGYKLVSALGTSNIGTVTYNVGYDAGKVAADIDGLVHGFVQSRQNMIANTIEVPGLLQRRQMQKASDPITARMTPSQEGMTLGFSTSLSQLRAAGGDADAASAPFNVWIGGAFLAHNDKNRNDSTGKWGSFAMINMGADYLLSDRALIGLSFHYDRMTDPTEQDAELTGNGWLAGPYASIEIGRGVFWNGSLRYGGSNNTINTTFWNGSFKTTRWMADTSIDGQWSLDEDTTISPKLRMIYFSEKVADYTVKNGAGDAITIDGFNEDQFRVSLGAEIARSFVLENDAKLTPKLGVTAGFSGLDGSGAFGALTAGVTLQTANFWMLDTSILLNIEGDGQKSVGAKLAAAKKF
ncbi:putative Ig domain-containing protein [Rhizobium freirei]|uniref:putative Ig domain-containing protein n=1 Tax=Rhizobium freirei TaxID=1353277 RepID=UPI001427DB19|nr:putative Ig domain-containing protein [Rhizobium freirei]